MASLRETYRNYLRGIAAAPRQDEGAVGPSPSDAEVAELAGEFRDAVLYLYNNTLRVCGVRVGDADSESNAVLIYERLGRTLYETAGDGLATARRDEIYRLEQEEGALDAEADRLREEAAAAQQKVNELLDRAQKAAQRLADVGSRIRTLKRLV